LIEPPRLKSGSAVFGVFVGALAIASAQTQPPVPVDAITAIVAAFQTHSIVTIADDHGDQQVLAFTLSLIRDPRFAASVDDLVVETGNSRYQDLMDRYVRGEDVPFQALKQVWENHTVPGALSPSRTVPEIYQAVRAINSTLPRERRLRVLLGDPPIDWDTVRTPADHRRWLELRDSHPAALIQLQVLAKQRRALVTYGQGHLQRRQMASNYDMDSWQAQTIVSILERTTPTSVFTVWRASNLPSLLPDVASWKTPSIAAVRGTVLGAIDFAKYWDLPMPRASINDGRIVPLPKEQWRVLPMEEQFDAVLYLGRSTSTAAASYSPDMCVDRAYLDERLRRLTLGGPQGSADRLKEYCGSLP
jgi:hypothetical protein